MGMAPPLAGNQGQQLFLCLPRVCRCAQANAVGHPKNMGIHGNGGDIKSVAEDDAGGFSPYSGQGFQLLPGSGHHPPVFVQQLLTGSNNICRLSIMQAAAANQFSEPINAQSQHCFRSRSFSEQARSNLVNPDIGTLGGQNSGNHQFKGIAMV